MAKLEIHVRTRKGRTESMYAVSRGRKVVFHNTDCDEPLEVTIEWLEEKVRKLSRRRRQTFVVKPNGKGEFDIPRKTAKGTKYKYWARIGRTKPEDPIIYVPGKH
ncbi:MAG TPA: hypothetical protein VFU77_00875 [Steroidobacteraceae bacterium]|nr:hypothetical protein [Steroidobacteraceae bacterium]